MHSHRDLRFEQRVSDGNGGSKLNIMGTAPKVVYS